MDYNRTFAIIKPDAFENKNVGEIIFSITQAGFDIVAMRLTKLSMEETVRFYKEHEGKFFYDRLINYISSGPIIAMILEKENAIDDFRKLIGSTDPSEAAEGTIRQRFGVNVPKNSIHGSDSPENAEDEWSFFFSERDILY